MTSNAASRATRRTPSKGVIRITEAPLHGPGVAITGVGQSLFQLFRDELMRRHARGAKATSEVRHA